jgi:hypothetical protein
MYSQVDPQEEAVPKVKGRPLDLWRHLEATMPSGWTAMIWRKVKK